MKFITYIFAAYALGLAIGYSGEAGTILFCTGLIITVLWLAQGFFLKTILTSEEVSKMVAKFTMDMIQNNVEDEVKDILTSVVKSLRERVRDAAKDLTANEVEPFVNRIMADTFKTGVEFKTRKGNKGRIEMGDDNHLFDAPNKPDDKTEVYNINNPEDVEKAIARIVQLRERLKNKMGDNPDNKSDSK